MESIIAVAQSCGLGSVGLKYGVQRFVAAFLRCEGYDGSCAACYCGAGSRFPAVACGTILLGEMDVGVYAAGSDVGPFSIQDGGAACDGEIEPDADNLAAFDPDLEARRENLVGCDLGMLDEAVDLVDIALMALL